MARPAPVAFLKIKGVPGSSIKKDFEEQISVYAYEHAIVRSMGHMHDGTYIPQHQANLGGRLGNTREAHQPFIITKGIDRATVPLLDALNTSKQFKDPVELSILQSVQSGEVISLKICFKEAMIQGIEYSEASGEGTVERVRFAYNAIEWTYEGLDEGGKKTGALSAEMSLAAK